MKTENILGITIIATTFSGVVLFLMIVASFTPVDVPVDVSGQPLEAVVEPVKKVEAEIKPSDFKPHTEVVGLITVKDESPEIPAYDYKWMQRYAEADPLARNDIQRALVDNKITVEEGMVIHKRMAERREQKAVNVAQEIKDQIKAMDP